jgi:hemolysin III
MGAIADGMTPASRDHLSRGVVVDRWLHGIGLATGPLAVMALLWSARHSDVRVLAGLAVYCAGLLAMIGCSALYHLSGAVSRRALLRRLDHAAIFLLIAGTYTPFALNGALAARAPALLAIVWALAAAGIALKLLAPATIENASVAIYLLLGWSVLGALDAVISALSTGTLVLLAAGGVLYTTGVIFHVWESLPYQNAIWHGFVLAGASCHYVAIFEEIG